MESVSPSAPPSALPEPPAMPSPVQQPPLRSSSFSYYNEWPAANEDYDPYMELYERKGRYQEEKVEPKKKAPSSSGLLVNEHNHRSPVPWSSGLCDCCKDLSSCCLTCWCPCITFGRIAEMVDRGSTSCGVSGALYSMILCVAGCSCLYSCFYRSKLRGQYFLEEKPCADCCVHCCCEGCALCQEYRQLKSLGFDPSFGWHGNMERQKRLATTPPALEKGFNR